MHVKKNILLRNYIIQISVQIFLLSLFVTFCSAENKFKYAVDEMSIVNSSINADKTTQNQNRSAIDDLIVGCTLFGLTPTEFYFKKTVQCSNFGHQKVFYTHQYYSYLRKKINERLNENNMNQLKQKVHKFRQTQQKNLIFDKEITILFNNLYEKYRKKQKKNKEIFDLINEKISVIMPMPIVDIYIDSNVEKTAINSAGFRYWIKEKAGDITFEQFEKETQKNFKMGQILSSNLYEKKIEKELMIERFQEKLFSKGRAYLSPNTVSPSVDGIGNIYLPIDISTKYSKHCLKALITHEIAHLLHDHNDDSVLIFNENIKDVLNKINGIRMLKEFSSVNSLLTEISMDLKTICYLADDPSAIDAYIKYLHSMKKIEFVEQESLSYRIALIEIFTAITKGSAVDNMIAIETINDVIEKLRIAIDVNYLEKDDFYFFLGAAEQLIQETTPFDEDNLIKYVGTHIKFRDQLYYKNSERHN